MKLTMLLSPPHPTLPHPMNNHTVIRPCVRRIYRWSFSWHNGTLRIKWWNYEGPKLKSRWRLSNRTLDTWWYHVIPQNCVPLMCVNYSRMMNHQMEQVFPCHLVMTNIAMEKITIQKKGKPSISMGHLYHGYVSHNQMAMMVNDG